MKHYVIIGGGIASIGCIEGIRSVDAEGPITLISGEGRPVYCRPLISYYLQGKADLEKMKYRPDSFYSENNCELVYGKAVSVDAAARKVELSDGRRIPYDALCVATGSANSSPQFNGLDTVTHRFGFMTEDDALAINAAVTPESKVLIVGAGLIGLKCAEALAERAGSVTVCNRSPRVLGGILDEAGSVAVREAMETHGVLFALGDLPESFEEYTAHMKSGDNIPFDVLVLAAGSRPDTALLCDFDSVCGRGVLVDKHMRTAPNSIYAAGDCTEGLDASTGERRVLAIMPNAYMQGNCAGVNMAGGDATFDTAIPMNAISLFGLHVLTAGRYVGELHEIKTQEGVKRLYVSDGLLAGFILIGDVAGAGIYTAMLREKRPLETADFELLCSAPSLAAFSSKYRGKMLGEVV